MVGCVGEAGASDLADVVQAARRCSRLCNRRKPIVCKVKSLKQLPEDMDLEDDVETGPDGEGGSFDGSGRGSHSDV